MALGFQHHGQEGAMFQMIDDQKPSVEERKMLVYKIGVFVAILGALGVIGYFLATSHYLQG